MTYEERKVYLPKQYLFQKMDNYISCQSAEGNFDDAQRNYECKSLTNDQIMERVIEAIRIEKEKKLSETERTEEIIQHDWRCFVKSKLVNKTYAI